MKNSNFRSPFTSKRVPFGSPFCQKLGPLWVPFLQFLGPLEMWAQWVYIIYCCWGEWRASLSAASVIHNALLTRELTQKLWGMVMIKSEDYSIWEDLIFIVWKGSWFWLFIAPKCVKSQNQLPLHSKMLNSSHCCEGSVLTEDIWIISEKWKWNFKCMPVFQKFASVWSCQWKWKDVWFCSRED